LFALTKKRPRWSFFYFTKLCNCFQKASSEKSCALFSDASFIDSAFSGVISKTAFFKSSTLASSEIRIPVSPSIIVSFNPHSFTPITGFPADIDSTGLIQKSSSIGI
jgi:hypothetical protein